MKHDIFGNIATQSHVALPVKSGCGPLLDKNGLPMVRTLKSCQSIANRMAKKCSPIGKWSGIVVDCGTHYRINIAA